MKYLGFILLEHAYINKQDTQKIYEFKESSCWFWYTLYSGFKNVEINVQKAERLKSILTPDFPDQTIKDWNKFCNCTVFHKVCIRSIDHMKSTQWIPFEIYRLFLFFIILKY